MYICAHLMVVWSVCLTMSTNQTAYKENLHVGVLTNDEGSKAEATSARLYSTTSSHGHFVNLLSANPVLEASGFSTSLHFESQEQPQSSNVLLFLYKVGWVTSFTLALVVGLL